MTRRRILAAAADLFVENGYPTTTLEQIAERAGVAVQTVYFHYGNKRTVLKEAVDVAAVGDDEPVALLDRPSRAETNAEPDPRRLVARWVHDGAGILDRVAPIMRVVRDAASGDPEMAAQWATNEQQRLTAFRVLTQLLADRDALKPTLSVDEATDIAYALLSIELYLLLTGTLHWDSGHWERWISSTLADALLQESPRPTI